MTYLVRTNGTATSTTTFTISTWVKRALPAGDQYVFSIANNNGVAPTEHIHLRFASDKLQSQFYISDSQVGQIETSNLFRDFSAWYNIVFRFDSTQSTANDRMRLYVNGTESSLGTQTMPSQSASCAACSGGRFGVSVTYSGTSNPFRGYMTQFIYADGQSYAPSTFGSTNTNGIWVPNTGPSVTYGNNGFKLDFAGTAPEAVASGFGADSSGNNNHLATGGEGTNPSTTDTPQNVFCMWNNLANSSMTTLSTGALIATGNTSSNNGNSDGTIAPAGGKWYWEVKYVTAASSSGTNYPNIGAYAVDLSRQPKNGGSLSESGYWDNGCSYKPDGSKFTNNSTASYGTAWSAGDIIGVALDLENYAIYFSRNGSWQDSGDPTSGASKTGSATNFTTDDGEAFVPAISSYNNSVLQTNFGNSPFALASGNADANGEGSFEYAPPTGYYALCTNNLALYGG